MSGAVSEPRRAGARARWWRSRPAGIPLPVMAALCVFTALAAGFQLNNTVVPALGHVALFGNVSYDIQFALIGGLLVLRGLRRDRGWLLIGLGAICWAAGDLYWSLDLANLKNPPVPSWADGGYLSFCPLAFAGIFLLLRRRAAGTVRTLAIDAFAAALSTGALSAAIVFHAVLQSAQGGTLAVATNLAYPLFDLLLLGLVIGAWALADWRLSRTLALIGVAVISFWIADSLYLINVAAGTYSSGAWYNTLWFYSPLLFAWAAWLPVRPAPFGRTAATARGITILIGFAAIALGILVWSSIHSLGALAIGLATASLLVILGRLVMTWSENLALLRASQTEAVTDSLTGLMNRRALARDLERALQEASEADPMALVLFDLDGFKSYNDNFGHPAGDALLQRLGVNLAARLRGTGTAYRMGGDEFCALLPLRSEDAIARAAEALHEYGEGFAIGCSYGWVRMPGDAESADEALRIADGRMYAHKQSGRMSAQAQSRSVLLRALAERNPELGAHLTDVATLAAATAHELALDADEVEQVRQAAELHDVGKVAIPDAILGKPGPLNDDEWMFIRRHTIIGERIISAAPALARIGALVRSSHENVDGSGYPDGLAGDEIPLGSRVISVCDAFDAMTTDRPYRPAMEEGAALSELRRCADRQFDAAVVEAFSRALAKRPVVAA